MSLVKAEVGPEDISVCVSLPTDLESFRRCLNKPVECGDYVRAFERKAEDSTESQYEREYEAKAKVLQRFIRTLRERGVDVFCCSTLNTVSEASAQRDILVFAGHWKGHSFTYWDILGTPEAVFSKMKASNDILVRGLTEFIEAREPDLAHTLCSNSESSAPRLRSALNRRIEEYSESEPTSQKTIDILVQRNPAALRERIDQELGCAILPGNRFEMADRFVDAYTFANALQNEREGILDCVVCKSDHPAPAIRRERGLILPITAEIDRHPFGWPHLIEAIVRLLSRQRMSYWSAREQAIDLLTEIAKENT